MEYRELDNLVVFELLKNFALSLIGVFIPVYILSSGLGLLHAALFIVLSGVTGIVLSYPVSRVISRIGFKHGLLLSYFFLIPGIVAVRYLELSFLVIAASSIFYNVGRLFHNIGLNSEFAVDSDGDSRADDSGKMLSLPSISRVLAPLLGGLIFAGYGFTELMIVAVFMLVISAVPLLLSKEHRDPMDYNMRELLGKEFLKTVPLFVARGIQAVTAVAIFGLYVYEIVGGSLDVGAARALDSLGFVLTGLMVGKFADKVNKNWFVAIGCLGAASVYMLRGFMTTPLQVFAVSFVGGIFFQVYHIPVYSSFADEAEDTEVLEFYTLRKIFVSLGNILTVGALSVFYLLYDIRTGFLASFTLGALATLMMAAVYLNDTGFE